MKAAVYTIDNGHLYTDAPICQFWYRISISSRSQGLKLMTLVYAVVTCKQHISIVILG